MKRFLNRVTCMGILGMVLACGAKDCPAQEQPIVQPTANFYPLLKGLSDRNELSMSYLAKRWPDTGLWRQQGRAKMEELLAYSPRAVSPEPEILAAVKKQGYTRYHVRYRISEDRKTEAFLLIPDNLKGPAPAVMALHDHGGFYYFGKEKITETENQPEILKKHIESAYGGRPFADELARRGFVVLAPDAFYFGSQRLSVADLPEKLKKKDFNSLPPGTDDYIKAYNSTCGQCETVMARTIFVAGSTWAGIFVQGDRGSLDYLLTRPEVDPSRVGCMGLSGGGFRSLHLFGLDGRIKTAVVAGFMTTYDEEVFPFLVSHTWMAYVPGQYKYLDLPDVVTLNAPNPLMVLNCSQDNLFSMPGMKAAEGKIAEVYSRMSAPDRFQCQYYDAPHSLLIPAQEDGIHWLQKWLK